ncbi:MAG TPA: class I SAM-dependent methyltransferase [Solirubrobacteraceae bacterium]|nr:class I SAM-dependent methyltransferase [Solirubrobacteraceae bacterium]
MQELQDRIQSYPVWHYKFDFDGVSTPIHRSDWVNRHEQRRRSFFDPLVAVAGGTLHGKRVLDLGSNAGYWSLAAIEAGADFVLGIDGRQMHVDQANLVFEAKGVDRARYNFVLGDIFKYDFAASFDVVLCLGLMYHISKPMELFEIMAGVDAQLLLIDTAVSLMPTSMFRVAREDSLRNVRNAVDHEIVLIPSRRAVLDLADQFGYTGVAVAHHITDFTGMADYKTKQRAAFVCGKGIPLDGLAREKIDAATLLRAGAGKWGTRQWRRARSRLPTASRASG